jgi:integrase
VDWGIIETNPLAKVKPLKVDRQGVIRYLTDDEERRLREALATREEEARAERESANRWRAERGYPTMPDLRAVPYVDHLRPLTLLALNTGLRRGELFNLEWWDIDIARASLAVRGEGAKSAQTRHVPLNDEAARVLRDWQKSTGAASGLVFPSRDGQRLNNIKTAWTSLMARAGISEFRFHDLRHTFASHLVMAGVDLNTVRELLGHGDIKMTLRYAHLAPGHKAEAVAKLVSRKNREGQNEKTGS